MSDDFPDPFAGLDDEEQHELGLFGWCLLAVLVGAAGAIIVLMIHG